MLIKNPENYEWKRPENNKISMYPDRQFSEKINEFLNNLRDKEISVSPDKVLKFVIRNIKARTIANKMIFSKKQRKRRRSYGNESQMLNPGQFDFTGNMGGRTCGRMRGGIEGRKRGSIRFFEKPDKASKNKELHHTTLLTSLSSPTFGGSIGRSAA